MKKLLLRYFMITLGCLLMSLAINGFYVQEHFLSGGLSGLALILYYIFKLPVGTTSFVLNIPLFYIAYKQLGKTFFINTVIGTAIFSLILNETAFLSAHSYVTNPLLACVGGGILTGMGSAFIYRNEGSTGGFDIISFLINKYYGISISTCNLVFGLLLMIFGLYYFGIEPVLYSLVLFYISFKFTNLFMVGFDYKKSVMIVSDKAPAIATGIIEEVGRGVTYFYGEGAFTHQNKKIVFAVVKLTQINKIKEIIQQTDPYAFVIVQDANDVLGRGFTAPNKIVNPEEIEQEHFFYSD